VTTTLASLIISLVSIFGVLDPISIPFSFMAWTTTALTFEEGTVPALEALIPRFLAKASAIWLLPAFSTHTNNIELFGCPGMVFLP
jgi:hypothetical protein